MGSFSSQRMQQGRKKGYMFASWKNSEQKRKKQPGKKEELKKNSYFRGGTDESCYSAKTGGGEVRSLFSIRLVDG